MSEAWYAAFGLLAILTLLNTVILAGLLRQLGVLHQRIRPIGPGMHEGPRVGAVLPKLDLTPVSDMDAPDPFDANFTLIGYVSPDCGVCRELPGFLHAYARTKPDNVQLLAVLATDATFADAAAFAEETRVKGTKQPIPMYRHDDIRSIYGIPGSPYVLALGATRGLGRSVLGSGVVNTLEQLEELVESAVMLGNNPVEVPGETPSAQGVPGGRRNETGPDLPTSTRDLSIPSARS